MESSAATMNCECPEPIPRNRGKRACRVCSGEVAVAEVVGVAMVIMTSRLTREGAADLT
jgi:hypothetical protein